MADSNFPRRLGKGREGRGSVPGRARFSPVRILILIAALVMLIAGAVSCNKNGQSGPDGPDVTDGSSEAPTGDIDPATDPAEEPTEEPQPTEEPEVLTPEKDIVFSLKGGIYTTSIEIEMTGPEGYEIYYTTDGSTPDKESRQYSAPLSLGMTDKKNVGNLIKSTHNALGYPVPTNQMPRGRVVRAVGINAEGERTEETIETYMMWSDGVAKYDAPIISLVVEPDDFGGKTGIYYTTMQSPFTTKRRVTALCEIYDETGKKRADQWVEISLSGNGSLGNLQKSIRLYFKSDANPDITGNPGKLRYDLFRGRATDVNGYKITSFKRILLRNAGNDAVGSFMADRVSQKLSSMLNVDYQEARSVVVFINGELWGTYNARERYSPKYFTEHYGILEENFAMLEAPTPLVTGNGNSPYELCDGTEQDVKDWEDLVKYITGHDMGKDKYYTNVIDKLDIDSLIDTMIAHMYLCNGDFPWNNVKVWRCTSENDPSHLDQKWRFVVMDMDGGLLSDYNSNMFNHALNDGTILGSVVYRLLKNSQFKQQFIERCLYAADVVYTEERCLEVINATVAEMEKPITANFQRWAVAGSAESTWKSNINSMKRFAAKRRDVWLSQLYAYFNISPTSVTAVYDDAAVTVKLNGAAVKNGVKNTLGMLGSEVDAEYEITVKDGYELSAVLLSDAAGKQKELGTLTGTIGLNDDATLTVCAVKKGVSTKTQYKIAAGATDIFALTEDGTLYAWGNNSGGSMGIARRVYSRPMMLLTGVRSVATAQGGGTGDLQFTYVLMADGRVLTAGDNSAGQLGREGNSGIFDSIKIPGNGQVAAMSLGYDHALLLMSDGTLYGVGNNAYSQLGNTGSKQSSSWIKIADGVVSAAAGRRHTLYVTADGSLYGLGDNRWSKLSSSAPEMITTPYKLASDAVAAFAGEHSAFYIDRNGVLYYMGTRAESYVSGGATGKMNRLMDNVASVSMQEGHALILTRDGKLYGWGENGYGQSKSGSTGSVVPPVEIAQGVSAAGTGVGFSAYFKDGLLVVWGKNDNGIAGKGAMSEKISRSEVTLSRQ